MALERSFSFSQDDDTSYRGANGYQVARGTSPQPPPGMTSLDSYAAQLPQRQPELASQPHGYPTLAPETDDRRKSAYRMQRQEAAAAAARQSPRKPLPPPPRAGGSRNNPMPSAAYATSQSPPQAPVYGQESHLANSYSYPAAPMDYRDGAGFTDDGRSAPYRDNAGYAGLGNNGQFRHSRGDLRQDMGSIEPAEIADDDDDPFSSISKRKAAGVGATGVAAAGAGGFLKNLGGTRDASGSYGSVPGGSGEKEKRSDWLRQQTTGNKRLKWLVGGLIVLVIVLAVTGGVVGAVLSKKSSPAPPASAKDANDVPTSGTVNKHSPAISELMGNKRLHKVFPGIDYSPLNTQYPACLTDPPLQNNVTADIAVLSQLTPIVRLYGTDCEQTEMVLTAIKDLGLEKSMKVWGGVYLDSNTTTNSRQISQLYKVLDKYGGDQFEGIIVGNEVLFSEYMSETELISKMEGVRSNLNKMGLTSLKVATSDLGSAWTSTLAEATDVVMANVHPFFGGVAAPQAANWTYTYWTGHDVILTDGTPKGNVIAETGWPTSGGNYCASLEGSKIPCTSNTQGSVAGISELNTFMQDWVCNSLERGTNYFWFEAFDEPWKVQFNTKNEHWEPKWGLMDVNRVLKPGVVIPSCGGKTAKILS